VVGVKGLIEGPPGVASAANGTREGLSGSFGLHAFLEDRDGNRWSVPIGASPAWWWTFP